MNRYFKIAPGGPKSLSVRQPGQKKLVFEHDRPTPVAENSPMLQSVVQHERAGRLIETNVYGAPVDHRVAAQQRAAAARVQQQAQTPAGPVLPPGFVQVNHRERAELGVRARG